jgi:MATE family multidrug resistance protein
VGVLAARTGYDWPVRRLAFPSLYRTRRDTRDLIRLALPLIAAQIAQISLPFVDTAMAGRIGPEALAGIALGSTFIQFLTIFAIGILLSIGPTVSQAVGRGDRESAARAARQGVWIAVIISVPGFVLMQFAGPILLALGQDPGTVELAAGYLRVAAFGFLPSLVLVALRGFLEGNLDTRPILYVQVTGALVNVVADPLFMFGWGPIPIPAFGLVGTGIATAIVYTVMALVAAGYVATQYAGDRVLRGMRRPDPTVMLDLLRVGWPIGLTLGFEAGLFTASALLMGLFGEAPLAAHQITIQAASITFMVPLGFSIAAGVQVGQAAGRGSVEDVRRMGIIGIVASGTFMISTALLFWLAPLAIVRIFTDAADPAAFETVRWATGFLAFAALFQVADGVQVAAAGALRGLRDTRIPMLLSVGSYWGVGLSSGVLLAFVGPLGPNGLWAGLVLGLSVAAVVMTARFLRLATPGRAPVREPLADAPGTPSEAAAGVDS